MFKVTARTVLELGAELISSDIIAFYELIKNGFDAGTKNGVEIRFNVVLGLRAFRHLDRVLGEDSNIGYDGAVAHVRRALNADAGPLFEQANERLKHTRSISGIRKAVREIYGLNTVTISDTGSGMSARELEEIFLVIGTPSRKKLVDSAIRRKSGKSPFLGEKGIGRLSAMRIGSTLKIRTARKSDKAFNCLEIDWTWFDDLDAMLDSIPIEPTAGSPKAEKDWSGTDVVIGGLSSDWTRNRLAELAREGFSLLINPFAKRQNRKRIALFWNGERIAVPTVDKGLLDYAHASIKGEYSVADSGPRLQYKIKVIDLGFGHPEETDTIQYDTDDLLSIIVGKDSGLDISALESVGSFSFEAYWFNRRRLGAIDGIGDRATVKKLHSQWSGIRLYRDGFRVYPYGSEDDDWLNLDRRAFMSKGYTLNKIQIIGQVNISRVENPYLIDQTNREGLRETPEQRVLLETLRYAIQDDLRQSMLRVEQQYKEKKVDLTGAKDQIKSLEKRAKTAINILKRTASSQDRGVVNDLQETLFEFADFATRARRIQCLGI